MKKNTSIVIMLALAWSLAVPSPIFASPSRVKATSSVTQQTATIEGTVSDQTGVLIGATIMIKGTQNGTITDYNGKFLLKNIHKGNILQIGYIGYLAQEIEYTGQTVLNVVLKEDAQSLDEVVVTALGMKREKKSLGYAMQEVNGDELLEAHETNLANALSGKVSGVQIIRSSNGPGGSSKIQLRGSNSVTGLNQPLIVIDGVPIDNFTGAANNDFWNPSADMGNGLADINPEDIASMSVLKGASAAALYGSRAGSGVILITTKKGRKSNGLGVTISSSVSVEGLFMKPDMQKKFGQGSDGVFDDNSTSSWGARIEGQEYTNWNDKKVNMAAYDNIDNYFDTGRTFTENISFSQSFGKTGIYSSLTRMDNTSKIPGASLNRTNMMLRANNTFGPDDKWSFDGKIQYVLSDADNRPIAGVNNSNQFLTMYTLPVSMDIRDFSSAVDDDNEMLWYGKSSAMNPYWMNKYHLNNDKRDRFIMNAVLKYEFTDWLTAELRAGSDMYFTETENKTYGQSPLTQTGRYSIGEKKFYENNFSFLFSARKDNIYHKWGLAGSFGGNLMEHKSTSLNSSSGDLEVLNLFALNNGKEKPSTSEGYSHKKMNSIYGTGQINYNGWGFIDATFRNDWTSTLSKENRSFFYPSISGSWVISDMINKEFEGMPKWFTYAKARLSFAQVGNDMDPYQLYNTYSVGKDPLGHTTTSQGGTLYNSDVRNELISSWEAGADIRFFDNRLGLDVTWYKSNARRQLLNLPMNPLSGYGSRKINAGDIQNEGWEIMLSSTPLILPNGFRWDMMINFSTNKNKILELNPGEDTKNEKLSLGGYDNVHIYAVEGGNYGEIWGTKYKRVSNPKSEFYGKIIVDDNGLPLATATPEKIGDQQATGLFGITNTLNYKGFALSFLIDGRIGGDMFSATNRTLQSVGTASVTVEDGLRENMLVDGVKILDAGADTYAKNETETTPQKYWSAVTGRSGNLGIGEANIYDATNIRLRNLSLNYTFPSKLLTRTPLQRVKLGVSINNVCMISSHMNGVDPESVYATSTNAVGFEANGSPTSRTYLFNITLGF